MQPGAPDISTCPKCGGVLEETSAGRVACMSCLLRAGIGSEEEIAQKSTPNAFEDGGHFGVYEIERVRRAGPLDAGTGMDIAQQVTSALAAAEKHGLVHRDLKPANLMLVSSDGETGNHKKLLVKIIDFGLAKAIHTQTDPKSLTHDRFVGTPAFASPEQFEHSALDVRSDIYSLGETLWFALTGHTPFPGRTM